MAAASIHRADFDALLTEGQAGERDEASYRAAPRADGNVWWLANEGGVTVLNYGYIWENVKGFSLPALPWATTDALHAVDTGLSCGCRKESQGILGRVHAKTTEVDG